MTWLPKAEEKLQSMSLISANARSVRIQIEEFKVRFSVVSEFASLKRSDSHRNHVDGAPKKPKFAKCVSMVFRRCSRYRCANGSRTCTISISTLPN